MNTATERKIWAMKLFIGAFPSVPQSDFLNHNVLVLFFIFTLLNITFLFDSFLFRSFLLGLDSLYVIV